MAKIFSGWWQSGTMLELKPGEQRVWAEPVGSLVVPDGERVVIYHEAAQDNKAPFFYAGTYAEMYHLRGYAQHNRPKLIRCMASDVETAALATLKSRHQWSNGYYDSIFQLPPGDYDGQDAGRHFPNDRLTAVAFTAAGELEVFEHGGYGGRHVALPPGAHDLAAYGLQGQVSSIRYRLDSFEQVGVDFGEVENKQPIGEAVFASDPVRNTSQVKGSYQVSVSRKEAASFSWQWSVTAGVTLGASVKASTGALPGGEVTASVEVSLAATTGQERQKTVEQDLSRSLSVELEPGQAALLELLVRHYVAQVPIRQQLKNQRTGVVHTREGHVRCRFSQAEAVIKDA